MEEWKGGRMEGWKIGRMEDWKGGRMEGVEIRPPIAIGGKDGSMGNIKHGGTEST